MSWSENIRQVLLQQSEGSPVATSGVGDRWHFHPEIELTFLTEGEGLRFVGDDIAAFSAPDLVLIGSNLPHHWQTGNSSGFCVQFAYGPDAPLANLRESSLLTSLVKRASRGLSFSPRVATQVEDLLRKCVGVPPLTRLANILQILQRLRQARPETLSKTRPVALEQQSAAIQTAVNYIIDHAGDESLQLQDVLDRVHMSRATFSRHFQTALGLPYTQFLQNLRLETARRLLGTTDQPIIEIAFESGFANLSHFNALFRQRWSMTPRELRGKLRGG